MIRGLKVISRQFSTSKTVLNAPDTVYALSTAPGRAAISIIRVSGPNCVQLTKALKKNEKSLIARSPTLMTLYNKENLVLDQALVLYFAKGHSYTGEDLVEFHLHGSPAVVRAVMKSIQETGLGRHAEPGEFTKRAFYNGSLDLAQVEGIRDLIDADTELQRQAAVAGASGDLSRKLAKWRTTIVNNMAMLTALIDFADDNEIDTTPKRLISQVHNELSDQTIDVKQHLEKIQHSELIQEGIKLSLLGPPNAGKSSIVNRLVNRNASIVSDIPGTTRDVVQVNLDIGGHKVIIGDTAGLRNIDIKTGHDQIELLGIEKARQVLEDSHIILAVFPVNDSIPEELQAEIDSLREKGKVIIQIQSKIDLESNNKVQDNTKIGISTINGDGFPELVDGIADACKSLVDLPQTGPVIGASQRTREILELDVIPSLERSLAMLELEDVTLAHADLQMAADGIGKITGQGIKINEVLGVVFGNFCIGK